LSHETAFRRAQTVVSWVGNVADNSPDVIQALAERSDDDDGAMAVPGIR
jgi:hypothetical protein